MHTAQVNFLPIPRGQMHAAMLERWHSLVDIAEIAASSGIRVSVVQAAWRDERIVRNGIDYHFVDTGAAGPADRSRRMAGLLHGIGAEVMHAQGLHFAGQAVAAARRLPAMPVICQDHANRPPRWWRRAQWRRWFAHVSGVAFTAADQALPFTEAGLFGRRTRVFAIPESGCRFTPGSRAGARAATGLCGDPCIVWVGHLARGKDPLTVLDGVALATARLPGLQLWCAYGSAPLLEEVTRRIHGDARLAGRVHFLGKVPHARIELLMRAADLFVSGSHTEGSGYSLLEALACGATPVVTDIPSFRALTGGGRIGELWPRGDAARLAEALVEAASRPSSRERTRAWFDAELSFPALGRRWADAYAQVRDDHARRQP